MGVEKMNDLTPETQALIDGIKISVLKDELEKVVHDLERQMDINLSLVNQLEEQPCKFNCRTEKDAWIAGWEDRDKFTPCVAYVEDCYKEWKKGDVVQKTNLSTGAGGG